MTPIEKSIELIELFKPHADWNNEYGSPEEKANTKHAKQCAIICVEQILEAVTTIADKKYDYYKEVLEHLKSL